MPEKVLQFADLSTRHLGGGEGLSAAYTEAVRICLDRHHAAPTQFQMRDNAANNAAVAKRDKADRAFPLSSCTRVPVEEASTASNPHPLGQLRRLLIDIEPVSVQSSRVSSKTIRRLEFGDQRLAP
jgi:hypothetical protein